MIDEATQEQYSIYQLVDPRDNLPFYVGYTSQVNLRLQQHLAGDASNLAKSERIAELRQLGLQPIMQVIDTVEGTTPDAVQRESYWIHLRLSEGMPLTNSVPSVLEHKRQTVYMPKTLATRLKVHAAATGEDISGIITRLVEEFLDRAEKAQ